MDVLTSNGIRGSGKMKYFDKADLEKLKPEHPVKDFLTVKRLGLAIKRLRDNADPLWKLCEEHPEKYAFFKVSFDGGRTFTEAIIRKQNVVEIQNPTVLKDLLQGGGHVKKSKKDKKKSSCK